MLKCCNVTTFLLAGTHPTFYASNQSTMTGSQLNKAGEGITHSINKMGNHLQSAAEDLTGWVKRLRVQCSYHSCMINSTLSVQFARKCALMLTLTGSFIVQLEQDSAPQ